MGIVGFVSAYRRPDAEKTIFVWQVAVAEKARGKGLALAMLTHLLGRTRTGSIDRIETTISPSNRPSQRLFAAWAATLGASVAESVGYDRPLFADQSHEEERLYIIDPPRPRQGRRPDHTS